MRRRRTKRRFKSGVYVSKKTGKEIHYRSSWELSFAKYLDCDATVATFDYECVIVSYITNVRSGRLRRYYPDFYVERVDGTKLLIEIKPRCFMSRRTNVKKWEAARKWCEEHGAEFLVLTEDELREMEIV